MASLNISAYMSGLLGVDVFMKAEGMLFAKSQYFVGCTVVKDGTVYDFQPVGVGIPGLFDVRGTVAFAIPQNILQNGEVIVALWNDFPSPSTPNLQKITEQRKSGNSILSIAEVNPIAEIGQSVVGTVTNVAKGAEGASKTFAELGWVLPIALIGIAFLVLKNK